MFSDVSVKEVIVGMLTFVVWIGGAVLGACMLYFFLSVVLGLFA